MDGGAGGRCRDAIRPGVARVKEQCCACQRQVIDTRNLVTCPHVAHQYVHDHSGRPSVVGGWALRQISGVYLGFSIFLGAHYECAFLVRQGARVDIPILFLSLVSLVANTQDNRSTVAELTLSEVASTFELLAPSYRDLILRLGDCVKVDIHTNNT